MKELQDIVTAYRAIRHAGQAAALATLVKVDGSTYRRPGARMLITAAGQWVGALSGGCLEADISDRAQRVMFSGKPELVVYDTTSDDDLIWGLGLGCQGIAQVLIEPLDAAQLDHPITLIEACLQHQQAGGIATAYSTQGEVAEPLGALLLAFPDGRIVSRIQSPSLLQRIWQDLQTVLVNHRATHHTYASGAGQIEVALQGVQPPVPLVIFGAGYDALPVVQVAKQLGWHVTVVDCRALPATRERFSVADDVCLCPPTEVAEVVTLSDRTAAVIMTHNYFHDRQLLQTLLPQPLAYLGLLGPKSRAQRLRLDLEAQNARFCAEHMSPLHSPIGLDIGAETPEEIALSIIAEIQSVMTHRSGHSLKHRAIPIHATSQAT
jgi:xanthine dehydrogenase accessory factor